MHCSNPAGPTSASTHGAGSGPCSFQNCRSAAFLPKSIAFTLDLGILLCKLLGLRDSAISGRAVWPSRTGHGPLVLSKYGIRRPNGRVSRCTYDVLLTCLTEAGIAGASLRNSSFCTSRNPSFCTPTILFGSTYEFWCTYYWQAPYAYNIYIYIYTCVHLHHSSFPQEGIIMLRNHGKTLAHIQFKAS